MVGDGDNCEYKVEAVTTAALRPVKIHNNWLLIGVMNMIKATGTIRLKCSNWSLPNPEPTYHLQK